MPGKSPKVSAVTRKALDLAGVKASAEHLAPLGPDELEIARLGRRKASPVEGDHVAEDSGGGVRLIVGLRRRGVDVDEDATYFRLKMALVRGLRRRFKRAQIEVDEADGLAEGNESFNVLAEPPDAATLEQANVIVARVLRWRRWDTSAR